MNQNKGNKWQLWAVSSRLSSYQKDITNTN